MSIQQSCQSYLGIIQELEHYCASDAVDNHMQAEQAAGAHRDEIEDSAGVGALSRGSQPIALLVSYASEGLGR